MSLSTVGSGSVLGQASLAVKAAATRTKTSKWNPFAIMRILAA